jgi:hypothetical protein
MALARVLPQLGHTNAQRFCFADLSTVTAAINNISYINYGGSASCQYDLVAHIAARQGVMGGPDILPGNVPFLATVPPSLVPRLKI